MIALYPRMDLKYSAQTQHVFPLSEIVKVANLMLQGYDHGQIRHEVLEQDLFELRSHSSRKGALRKTLDRLDKLEPEYIQLLANGNSDIKRLTLLFIVLKEHRLLQELITGVLIDKLNSLQRVVDAADLRAFFAEKRDQEPVLSEWSESTFQKAASNAVLALVRAGLLHPVKPKGNYEIRALPVPQELKQQLISDGYERYLTLLLN